MKDNKTNQSANSLYIHHQEMLRIEADKCNEQKLYEHNQYLLDQKSDQLHEMIEQEQIPNILN